MYAAQSTHLLIYDQILLSSWKPFEEGSGGICSIYTLCQSVTKYNMLRLQRKSTLSLNFKVFEIIAVGAFVLVAV